MKLYSQLGQDETVFNYYNKLKTGYFVEVGAFDGVSFSNTFALEQVGWKGVCVEPLPCRFSELVKNRSCKAYNVAAYQVSGKVLDFVIADSPMLSGDVTRIDVSRVSNLNNRISVPTMNLTEILDDAHAPSFIEFLSLDTEGSELDVLKGIDFKKYAFGYMTVEHNFLEPARTNIRNFLAENGYEFKCENKWDDDYVLKNK